ncbi:hypothetical protein Nepgr_032174 [Nepenthes gracilis]|uniref:TatD related DNase n=1 Tax=Nepenthes gracilis TaxID=150966 RepID=A0AAD3Y830_NEPGR|nr:hypothetical protein Nepgr_032174 [Nepenthes gracilis]
MKSLGPFPAGVILHSYLGSAEMVPEFVKLGAYFSFSGFLMSMKPQKAKKMLKAVPADRILLETDAPDALPKSDLGSLFPVQGDGSIPLEFQSQATSELAKEMLNHPANIHIVLNYVASLLEISKEELARISYSNTICLFSYEGSKVLHEESCGRCTNAEENEQQLGPRSSC